MNNLMTRAVENNGQKATRTNPLLQIKQSKLIPKWLKNIQSWKIFHLNCHSNQFASYIPPFDIYE